MTLRSGLRGGGKSGEPIEMAGAVVIFTRLAALSLPVTSRKALSSRVFIQKFLHIQYYDNLRITNYVRFTLLKRL
jgi:hypothetical protein